MNPGEHDGLIATGIYAAVLEAAKGLEAYTSHRIPIQSFVDLLTTAGSDVIPKITEILGNELTAERQAAANDYADMNKFQQRFMDADHELRDVKETLEKIRELLPAVDTPANSETEERETTDA